MSKRWWARVGVAFGLCAPLLAACSSDETWHVTLDAGSDSTRAEITIITEDDTKTFEIDLPWDQQLDLPNGSFKVTLRVRSLDGKKVGCGIGDIAAGDNRSLSGSRVSQGGGLEVECRVSGRTAGGEIDWGSDSEVLTPLPDATDPPDDTTPPAPDTTTADTAPPESTPPATDPPPTEPPTTADLSSLVVYSGGVLQVQLDDNHGGPPVVLSLAIGEGVDLGTPTAMPEFYIVTSQFPTATATIDLSPTFGDSLDELMPDAPDGLARDDRFSSGDLIGVVQQLNGEGASRKLYGIAVIGDWKARVTVFVSGSALDAGEVTMDQVAARLKVIMLSFAVRAA